jgi:hypothetical protein
VAPGAAALRPPVGSDATIRQAVAAVDADALDRVIGEWLTDLVRTRDLEEHQLVVAVDGKSLRGARQDDGRPVHLFAPWVQGDRAVIAPSEVDHKTDVRHEVERSEQLRRSEDRLMTVT